jgi:hypothetical protein
MAIDGRQLLHRLEPAVRPIEDAPRGAQPQRTIDQRSFADLLRAARAGEVASDRLPSTGALGTELPREALPRIATALDKLEAEGRDRAVIVYANRALVADVATRTIEAELLAHEGPLVEPVDAAVRVPTPEEDRPTSVLGPPKAVSVPADILACLEARDSHK